MNVENEQTERTLTFGEKAVGLTFNPGGNEEVDTVKKSCAATIDLINNLREEAKKEGNLEKIRMYSVAITEIQTAQMWAVKGITWMY